jgi:AMMECR1 domain-containing protein
MSKGRGARFKEQEAKGWGRGPALVTIGVMLLLVFFFCVAGTRVGSAGAGVASRTLSSSLESIRSDPLKREALARYARGAFLAGLSLGPEVAPPPWAEHIRHACFVTFFSGRQVIACAGGFVPRTPDLGREIMANVRQALLMDPRAGRIDRRTALAARVLITFPGEPRPVASPDAVDPAREGLFVENDRCGVAIVPGEAKTSSWAFREALRRLGENNPAAVRLFAFDAWGIPSEKP